MNAKLVAKNYAYLTPEERFRLILAADGRGDKAEQERLSNAGQRITLSMPDHSPWADAFEELSLLVFLELLDEAGKHHDAFERWCDAEEVCGQELEAVEKSREDHEVSTGTWGEDGEEGQERSARSGGAPADQDTNLSTRTHDLYRAQGFLLKTKIAGWKVFCERLSIPPFAVWKVLPGFDRLGLALELLEDNQFRPSPAFRPEEIVRWLGAKRPQDAPEPSMEQLISPESFADRLDEFFRTRVEWWGG